MIKKSTLLHLRIPFSYFLLPIFLFAVVVYPWKDMAEVVWIFVILHFFIYPASNGYNSYFDKDKSSIGGLKRPPSVEVQLYWVSLLFDLVGILAGWYLSWEFAIMLIIYGLVSKAYSHPSIRLKKMPYIGWLAAGIFQGYFTMCMVYVGLNEWSAEMWTPEIQFPALLSSILLFGSYPMTQVYQHEEDAERGDQTISLKLGIMGTFHFTLLAFTVAIAGFVMYFTSYYHWMTALSFLLILSPTLIYFLVWYAEVRKDHTKADYSHTMKLNMISATCFIVFFLTLLIF